jgi:uncharacterized Tic20 family protein
VDRPPLPTLEERRWAAAAHAGGPVGLLLSLGLLGFVAPLVVWVAKKEESPFVADQAREALNFQITLLGVHVAGWAFALLTLGLGLLVVLPVFVLLWLVELVLGAVGAIRANDGERYRYPFTLRFV